MERIVKKSFCVLLLVFCFISLVAFSSCAEEVLNKEDARKEEKFGTSILSFKVLMANGGECYPFLIRDSVIHVMVPNTHVDYSSLMISLEHDGEKCFVDDKEFVNGGKVDFSNDLHSKTFRIISSAGKEAEWIINLYDIPVLCIDTPDSNPIQSKEVRTEGCKIRLVEGDTTIIDLGTAGIKGRGNSTWLQDKKPYNIKLDKKHEILGMKKSKHWVLLANACYDRTQLHNATAFEMARLTDYPWVQSGHFVELILNNEQQGLYYLCEKIGIGKDRINIDEMTPEDVEGEALTGGYLLETTFDYESSNCFISDFVNTTGYGDWGNEIMRFGWELKEPDEDVQLAQWDYIVKELNHMEEMITNPDSLLSGVYRHYFDIESIINWYLVEEVCANEEASRNKNVYMYKGRGGRFVIGPPWDFDAWTFGLHGVGILFNKESLYMRYLLHDPYFVSRLKAKWQNFKAIWSNDIPIFINTTYDFIYHAAIKNEALWPDSWSSSYPPNSNFKSCVEEMRIAFNTQMGVVDDYINSL